MMLILTFIHYIYLTPRRPRRRSHKSHNFLFAQALLVVVGLEEIRVDKDGSSGQDSLLVGSSISGESDFKRIGISKDLSHERLGLFQDVAFVFFTTLVSDAGVVDSE